MRGRTDRRLLEDIRGGRREACDEFVRQHYGSIYGFLAHLTGDRDLAEELTQETFCSAWQAVAKFQGRASLRTWLRRIAYSRFVDSARRIDRQVALLAQAEHSWTEATTGPDPAEQMCSQDEAGILREAIMRLQHPHRTAIILHYQQGLSYREMKQVLGEPIGTIKARTSEALKQLRVLLNGRIRP